MHVIFEIHLLIVSSPPKTQDTKISKNLQINGPVMQYVQHSTHYWICYKQKRSKENPGERLKTLSPGCIIIHFTHIPTRVHLHVVLQVYPAVRHVFFIHFSLGPLSVIILQNVKMMATINISKTSRANRKK